MKYLKPLFLFVLTLGLFSCGDDTGPLEGTWSLESLTYSGSTTTTTPVGNIEQSFTGVGENIGAKVTFGMDDYSSTGSYDIVLTTTTVGVPMVTTTTYNGLLDMGTYTFVDPVLSVNNSNGMQDINISELSDSRMVMNINTTETTTFPLAATTIVNASYVLVK